MFHHLPCRKLRCFLLVNPLVIGSISSQYRTEMFIWKFWKVVKNLWCFLRLYYPFLPLRSLSFLYCFVFPLDVFACLFPSHKPPSLFLNVILSYSYSAFILFAWYLFFFPPVLLSLKGNSKPFVDISVIAVHKIQLKRRSYAYRLYHLCETLCKPHAPWTLHIVLVSQFLSIARIIYGFHVIFARWK